MEFVKHFSSVDEAADAAEALVTRYRGVANVPRVAAKAGIKMRIKPAAAASPRRPLGGGDSGDQQFRNVAHACMDLDDTLLNASDGTPIHGMVRLAQRLAAAGARIHVITARQAGRDAERETRAELVALGLPFVSLTLTPEEFRKDMVTVSAYKASQRERIAREAGAPIVLSVGDAWTDVIVISSEDELDDLDAARAAHAKAAARTLEARAARASTASGISLLRVGGVGSTIWGLKLKEQDE